MIDTNLILQVVAAVQAHGVQAQPAWNAWHVVALFIGGCVVHAYHVVVNAGGVRTIWNKFMGPKGESK